MTDNNEALPSNASEFFDLVTKADELADLCEKYKQARDNGRTPRGILAGIVMIMKEALSSRPEGAVVMPDGWSLVEKKTCYALMHGGFVIASLAGPNSQANAAKLAAILSAPAAAEGVPDADEETYQMGKRDGYEEAVQDIDLKTGGDGEYRYCTDGDHDRHTPDAPAMIARIVERFDRLRTQSPAHSEHLILAPRVATPAMLDRAVSFALSVSLSAEYTWSQYMADLWVRMLGGIPENHSEHSLAMVGAQAGAVPDIGAMVDRFLCWKLPADFSPDAGISFVAQAYQEYTGPHWPVGTNLLNAIQAKAMLEHVFATKSMNNEKRHCLVPTKEMIEAGAERLVSFDEGSVWPDSFSPLHVAAARNDAERVWRSMYLAAPIVDANKGGVPEGWKLLPPAMTREMRAAWDASPNNHEDDDVNMAAAYAAMLSAAPAAPVAAELEPVTGDLLPKIGSRVLIHLARQDAWVEHTVTGYYVWGDLGGSESLYRVCVRVVDDAGYQNARPLREVRPVDAALAARKADGKGGEQP